MVGDHLVDIADLSVVWVWAQFYQDDLPLLKQGLPVIITSGYDDITLIPQDFRALPRISKPFNQTALRQLCVTVFAKR